MPQTTVVFVHGFRDGPECWDPFVKLLEGDPELSGFRFLRYQYSTGIAKLNVLQRLPTIKQCGNGLGGFLDLRCPEGKLVLVGHSMGGLVIQYLLAEKLAAGRGADLSRIRSVILFATPNRGSTMFSSLRRIANTFIDNPQDEQLEVLNDEVANLTETIGRSIVRAQKVDLNACPIPFRAFWGETDAVVPESSARGSFTEANQLPGDHTTIIRPEDRDDLRYLALKEELLNPTGHPFIYEFERFEVTLTVCPRSPDVPVLLNDLDQPIEIRADNEATRTIDIEVSSKNRCSQPYTQMYRSIDGFVQSLSFTGTNDIDSATYTENRASGKKFTYIFTPDRQGKFSLKLKIYNGFGEGQRNWHNHMNPNAHYKLFRFTLDLRAFDQAGYRIAPEPRMGYSDRDIDGHRSCQSRGELPMVPYLEATPTPFLRTWEIRNMNQGIVDVSWDLQKLA